MALVGQMTTIGGLITTFAYSPALSCRNVSMRPLNGARLRKAKRCIVQLIPLDFSEGTLRFTPEKESSPEPSSPQVLGASVSSAATAWSKWPPAT